jgi:transcriptional regulator with XRE-family HTH domain
MLRKTDYGSELKRLRQEQNMNQQELADRLGIPKTLISMYETGSRYPSFQRHVEIQKYLMITAPSQFPFFIEDEAYYRQGFEEMRHALSRIESATSNKEDMKSFPMSIKKLVLRGLTISECNSISKSCLESWR